MVQGQEAIRSAAYEQLRADIGGCRGNIQAQMGYREPVQATEAELSPSFLLWRQHKCNTGADMGSTDSKSFVYNHQQEDKKAVCILANCNYDTSYADVLCGFYRFYGISRESVE